MPTIDLNADLGEGFGRWSLGNDDELLGVVTSANVACGFHAGDAVTMRRVCDRGRRTGVAVGAQVGYRDLAGFGRRFIDIEPADADRRRDLPDRRADGVRPRRRRPGPVRQAARRAVQRARPPRAAGRRRGRGRRAVDPTLPVLGLPGSAWLRARRARRASRSSRSRSPIVPTTLTGGSSLGVSPGRCSMIPRRSRPGACRWSCTELSRTPAEDICGCTPVPSRSRRYARRRRDRPARTCVADGGRCDSRGVRHAMRVRVVSSALRRRSGYSTALTGIEGELQVCDFVRWRSPPR